MKEMNYAEMQNVNGGSWIAFIIVCGVAIWVGGWLLPNEVEKLKKKYAKKYNLG